MTSTEADCSHQKNQTGPSKASAAKSRALLESDLTAHGQDAIIRGALKAQYLIGLADTPAQFEAMIQNDTAALADVFKDPVN